MVLVGASLGAAVAIDFAFNYPEAVSTVEVDKWVGWVTGEFLILTKTGRVDPKHFLSIVFLFLFLIN